MIVQISTSFYYQFGYNVYELQPTGDYLKINDKERYFTKAVDAAEWLKKYKLKSLTISGESLLN